MKKTINVAIGGCSFTIDEDAYSRLEEYLESFSAGLDSTSGSKTAADELEMRIADLLKEKLGSREVVDLSIVNAVLSQTGPVSTERRHPEDSHYYRPGDNNRIRKFFRDRDGKAIAGVCSGLALYLNIDVTLIRILFPVVFFFGSAGGWAYLSL